MESPVNESTVELVGTTRAMEEARRLIDLAAAADAPVLIGGEPGTGKEFLARAIHARSARAAGPFIAVPLGSAPERFLEGELFGAPAAGPPGAPGGGRGRLEEAHGGTVYLDRVAALPLSLQGRLLRVLDRGQVDPIGESLPRRLDVRVVAAAEGDLEPAARAGRFRRDLLARLGGFSIHLPPLRERRTDITLLADHFLRLEERRQGKCVIRITQAAVELLSGYPWPGNVRELRDVLWRAFALAPDGVIRARHLPPALQTGRSTGTQLRGSLEELLRAYERELLLEAMRDAAGNQSRAARALATTPRILAYRLRKHGLHPRERQERQA